LLQIIFELFVDHEIMNFRSSPVFVCEIHGLVCLCLFIFFLFILLAFVVMVDLRCLVSFPLCSCPFHKLVSIPDEYLFDSGWDPELGCFLRPRQIFARFSAWSFPISVQNTFGTSLHLPLSMSDPEQPAVVDSPAAEPTNEDIAHEFLDQIISAAALQLVENQINHALPDYTARAFLLDVYAAVQLQHIARDKGDSGPQSMNPVWNVESEPTALPTDVWARGMVPVKRRVKMKDPLLEAMHGSANSTKQADQLSARSGGSKTSKGSKQTTATTAFRKSGKSALDANGRLDEEDEDKVLKPFAIERPVSATAAEREKIREETLAAQNKIAALAKSKREKAEKIAREEKERAEKQAAELKGKEYMYNRDGSIVIIGSVNADKLAKINLEATAGMPPMSDPMVAPTAMSPVKGGKEKAKPVKSKTQTNEDEFKLGGGLSSVIDVIKMSAGVTLKEGGANKQGPPGIAATPAVALEHSSKNPLSPLGMGLSMTRRSYNEFIDTVQAQSAAMLNSGSNFNISSDQLTVQTSLNKMRPVDAASDPRAVAGLEDYPSIIPPSAGRPSSQGGASPSGLGSPTRLPKISAVEMYNEKIMEDASWGANPTPGNAVQFPNMPNVKPSASTFAESLGVNRVRLPRDRPFVSPTATDREARQHLPAPLFPATSGHGFVHNPDEKLNASLRTSTSLSTRTLALDKTSNASSHVHTTNLTKAFLQKLQAPPM
jgi:hypothetical protein